MNFEGTLEAGANLRDTWDEIVRAHADREFLIFEDVCENCVTTHTYAQADRQIARYANAFDAAGIRPGDRVVVYLPNSVEFVECLLALAFIGAVVVPLDTKATAFECVSHIQVSQARGGVGSCCRMTARAWTGRPLLRVEFISSPWVSPWRATTH